MGNSIAQEALLKIRKYRKYHYSNFFLCQKPKSLYSAEACAVSVPPLPSAV
jgi:hypothetical protein